MLNASPHLHRITAKWNSLLDVAGGIGGIWLPSVTCRRKQLSLDQWIFLHDARFLLWRTWHHTKCAVLCAGVSRGRLIGLLARYPVVFSRFLTVLVEMALLGIQLSPKVVLLKRGQRRTSRNDALSFNGRFLSLTSLVCWHFAQVD